MAQLILSLDTAHSVIDCILNLPHNSQKVTEMICFSYSQSFLVQFNYTLYMEYLRDLYVLCSEIEIVEVHKRNKPGKFVL